MPAPLGRRMWGLAPEPRGWNPQPGPTSQAAAPQPHPLGALTFHSARTSRASSRRPPSVLPRMIQMGICESSCLEISNVICTGREGARSAALLPWGPGGSPRKDTAGTWWESCIPSPGRCWRDGRCPASELPAPAQGTPELSPPGDPASSCEPLSAFGFRLPHALCMRPTLPARSSCRGRLFFLVSSDVTSLSPRLRTAGVLSLHLFIHSHSLVTQDLPHRLGGHGAQGPQYFLGAHENVLTSFKIRRKK